MTTLLQLNSKPMSSCSSRHPARQFFSVHIPALKPIDSCEDSNNNDSGIISSNNGEAPENHQVTKKEDENHQVRESMMMVKPLLPILNANSQTIPKPRTISNVGFETRFLKIPKPTSLPMPLKVGLGKLNSIDNIKEVVKESQETNLLEKKDLNEITENAKKSVPKSSSMPEIHHLDVSPKIISSFDNRIVSRPSSGVFEPAADIEPPCIISISSNRVFSSNAKFRIGPQIPSISDPSFEEIFRQKLEICSYIFDFSSPTINIEEKDIKSRSLCELVQFFEQSIEVRKISSELQSLSFQMLENNIFKQVPVFPSAVLSSQYTSVIIDPSWPHLFYAFQILNRFVQLFPESPHVNFDLAKRAISLTSLPDNNERLQLLAFLRSYFDNHPLDRNKLLVTIQHKLLDFIDGIIPPFCITPLLVLLAHIFTRSGRNPSPEYIKTIKCCVFPLILSQYLPVFSQHIMQLFNTIFIPQSPLIEDFFFFIKRFFPITDSTKLNCYYDMLFFLCTKLNEEMLKAYSKKILKRIADGISSSHFKVAEFTLQIFSKSKIDEWMVNHARHTVVYLYEAAKLSSEFHWNKDVETKAQHALAEMGRLHRHAFLKMRNQKGVSDSKRKKFEIEKNAYKNWSQLAKLVAQYDDSFNIKDLINDIKTTFQMKNTDSQVMAPPPPDKKSSTLPRLNQKL